MVGKDNKGRIYFFVRYKDIKGNTKQKRGFNRNWKTLKEAKAAEDKFLKTIGELPDKSIKTYGDLYKIYINNRKQIDKLSTLKTAEYLHKEHILPTFEDVKIENITPSRIESWQDRLFKSEYKNSYLKQIQSHFKRVLEFGRVYDYIPQNPFYRPFVKRKENTVKLLNFYSLDEYNKFVSVIEDTGDLAIFETLYWCGLRKGEMMSIKVKDINFEKRLLHIYKTYDHRHKKETTPKNKNGFRDLVLTDRVYNALYNHIESLKQYVGFDSETYVFGFHTPISSSTLDRRNREYATKSKVKRIRIHDFRHSHASLLINMKFDLFEIAKRLGHTVQELTETYGHWFIESQHNMVEEINSIESIKSIVQVTKNNSFKS